MDGEKKTKAGGDTVAGAPMKDEAAKLPDGGNKSGKRKIPWSIIYIALTVVAVVLFGVLNREFGNVFNTMKRLTPGFLTLSLLLSVLFFVFEGGIIRLLMNSQGIKLKRRKSLKIALIGMYYSYITPSATGGQPAQSAYLCRDNVPAGTSTAVLIIKFFCYQCAFSLCSLAAFIYMYPNLQANNPGIIPLIVLGIIVNGFSTVFFPSLFFKPVLRNICRFAKWLCGKFKFLQKRFKIDETIDKFAVDFSAYTDDFRNKTKKIVAAILLSIPQFILQMSVIYFIFRAFGYHSVSYPEVVSVQSLLQVSVSFMPMPGASGAQEIGFSTFFKNYFVNNDLYAAVMVWRFLTYYLVVIAGAVLVVTDQILYRKKQRKAVKEAIGKSD